MDDQTAMPMRDADRGVAALRALVLPVVFVGERLVSHPADHSGAFPFLLAAGAVWALVLLVLRFSDRQAPAQLRRIEPVVDLALIAALTYSSGGAFSQARGAFFVLPVLAALRLLPVLTAAWSAAAVVAFVAASLPHPSTSNPDAPETIAVSALFLAATGAAAVLLSIVLARRERAIQALAAERQRLVAQALEAEERERRRIAELLHDEAVQTLSLARQELADYHRHHRDDTYDRANQALRTTIRALRGEIFELHPYVLDHAGLPAALQSVVGRLSERTPARLTLEVDPDADGDQSRMIVAIARELLTNAVRHAGAAAISLRVAADADGIELEVSDDGCGFDAERRSAALASGHIGLASIEQRVAVAGGQFDVATAPGEGTRVRVTLPGASPNGHGNH